MHRIEAPSARGDTIMAFLARNRHADQILPYALGGDIGLKLGVGDSIAGLADIGWRLAEVRRGNENGKLVHRLGSPGAKDPPIGSSCATSSNPPPSLACWTSFQSL